VDRSPRRKMSRTGPATWFVSGCFTSSLRIAAKAEERPHSQDGNHGIPYEGGQPVRRGEEGKPLSGVTSLTTKPIVWIRRNTSSCRSASS
jgi:hypothetical protein